MCDSLDINYKHDLRRLNWWWWWSTWLCVLWFSWLRIRSLSSQESFDLWRSSRESGIMMTRMIISIMIICIIECKKGSSENEGERKKEAGNRAARVKRKDTEEETGDQRQRNLYLIIKNKTLNLVHKKKWIRGEISFHCCCNRRTFPDAGRRWRGKEVVKRRKKKTNPLDVITNVIYR